jgi:hypothetical protein
MAVTFQILTLYAINVNIVKVSAVARVFLIAVLFTSIIFILLLFITKDMKRSAILVTFYCFLFFTYGRLLDIIWGFSIAGLIIGRSRYLISLYALISIAGTLWIFRSQFCNKYVDGITSFLNMLSLVLFFIAALVTITNFDWITFRSKKHLEFNNFGINKETNQVSQSRKIIFQPNFYFIILDSYTSPRVLKKYYDWDDSGVVDALCARGFSVNKNAYSNYNFTDLSLGATLNMRYIHEDQEFIDAKSKSGYLSRAREQNKVMERFKSEGYDVVSIIGDDRFPKNKLSMFGGTKSLFSSDFEYLVVHVSILRIFESILMFENKRKVTVTILEQLKRLDIPNKPTFMYAHIMCPHDPYVFNADGTKPKLYKNDIGEFENNEGDRKKAYIEQVKFIGTQIIDITDGLRNRDPNAIIIVQADHGLGLGYHIFHPKRPPLEYIDSRYGILSAIYLPPGIKMPEKITPVNLFTYLFNAFFNAKLEILPNRAFFTAITEPYKFFEVTNDLKSLTSE